MLNILYILALSSLSPMDWIKAMFKKILKISASVLLLAVLVFIAGPRTEMDETLHPLSLPEDLEDLEQYIAQSEAAVAGIRPKVAKGIIWADSTQKNGHHSPSSTFMDSAVRETK